MNWPKLCRAHPKAAPRVDCYHCALDLWGQDFYLHFDDPKEHKGFRGYFITEQGTFADRSSG